SGNGDSEGDFEDSCPTKESADLGSVLDAVEEAAEELAIPEVVYVGHSMGAAVGVLRTSRDPRIARLVSLGGMVHTAAFAERKFGHQQPGDLMWDKPACPISQPFLDDMREVDSVLPLAPDLTLPWLLVHGDADTVVPPEESTEIAAKAGGAARVVLLEGVDHVFGDAGSQMAEAVVRWLEGE
ncbi:MAG: alpha/beta hydrolase, partial [Planctomycetota bacterium]